MADISPEKVDLLRQNARSVVRELGLLNDAYFEIGVTLAERHLLIELSTSSSPTMGEIAERLLLDKSTASRLIAKALKKGYIKITLDADDKRKRFLHLTELGKKTLNDFEPIAFNQTKQALLSLTSEEIDLVYQGVSLYAKGLRTARLQASPLLNTSTKRDLRKIEEPLTEKGFSLAVFKQKDENALYAIFKSVVDSGTEFPYESSSLTEFHRHFFAPQTEVYVCHNAEGEVVGGFYIKPNFSGRCAHIANAAYMVKNSYRGQGIGTWLVSASLEIAKNAGFRSMQFNMVLSQNTIALKLYDKFGFKIVGTIPEAVRNPDSSYQDGYVLFRTLN